MVTKPTPPPLPPLPEQVLGSAHDKYLIDQDRQLLVENVNFTTKYENMTVSSFT